MQRHVVQCGVTYISVLVELLEVGVTKWWRKKWQSAGPKTKTPPDDTYDSPLPVDSHLSVRRKCH